MSSPADDHDGDTSPSTLQLWLDVDDDIDGDGAGATAINPADLRAVLTDERRRLLASLHRETPAGIQDLADRLDRDYATVHADCELLADVGIVQWKNGAYGARVPVVPDTVTLSGTLVGDDERRHEQADSRRERGASRYRGQQRLADWLRREGDLSAVDGETIDRGDVVWVPNSDAGDGDRGLVLLVLGHDLPPEADRLPGVPLTVDETDHTVRIAPSAWMAGGPGLPVFARPWESRSVRCGAVKGQIGTVDVDTCNDVAIAQQVYLGPRR